MSTPARRKALRALARRKRINLHRVASGKKPIVKGKKVAVATLAKKGAPSSKAAARKRLARRR